MPAAPVLSWLFRGVLILGAGLLVTPTPVPVVVPVIELTPVALPLGVMLDDPAGVVEVVPALCAKAGEPAIKVAARRRGLSLIMRRVPG
jgi:hypothetical protein